MIKMKWFELNENERIKEYYSKYSINDFWNWWNDGKDKVMEVRIQNYNVIKEIAYKLKLEYSTSGVYVKNSEELKKVIMLTRSNITTWFGINSRKKSWSYNGKHKTYGSGEKGGSADINVKNIEFIFVDIDRKIKEGTATQKDLEHVDIVANEILLAFSKGNWNKEYCKLCSGNGIQLIFKLDVPFSVPEVDYDNGIIYNDEYLRVKNMIKNSIGNQINKFVKQFLIKYKNEKGIELNVEIDTKCFNLSRVGALPFTKNYKYDSFTWRGILDLKNETNEGLSDYILLNVKDEKEFKKRNVFKCSGININNCIKEEEFENHPVVRLMLDNDLPYGEINNILWYMTKALMQENNLDFSMPTVKKIKKELERKYKGVFTENFPNKSVKFNEDTINNYCIRNMIPPVFPLRKSRGLKRKNFMLNNFDIKVVDYNINLNYNIELDDNISIFEDMIYIRENILVEGDYNNNERMILILKKLVNKYSRDYISYLIQYRILDRYINWSTK